MADINSSAAASPAVETPGEGDGVADARLIEAMELLFFAYRDFVGDPDVILEKQGFGRAHHRVLHFVGRNPGITVQNLLAILRITKQSLARVLRQLVSEGHVEQRTGSQDRRQRHLYLTDKGAALWQELQIPQKARLARAFENAGPEAQAAWREVMTAMLDRSSRSELHPGADHLSPGKDTDGRDV